MNTSIEYRQITFRVLFDRPSDAAYLAAAAGAARFVWNHMLARQHELYNLAKTLGIQPPAPSYLNLSKAFTRLRNEAAWLRDYPFSAVRHVLKYQALAWQAFFRDTTGEVGSPRFQSRWRGDSLTLPDKIRIVDGKIWLPKRGSWLTLRRRGGHPWPHGRPVRAVFKRINGKWRCTICVAIAAPERMDDGSVTGIDMNAGQVATDDGWTCTIQAQPDTRRLTAREKRFNRRMQRQKKGSKRREKTRRRHARTKRRIAMQRRNRQHQVSHRLRNGTVVVEDLQPKAMTRSARGTLENPGRNVKAKTGLNRVIRETGWGALRDMLAYKAPRLISVNPANTSRECAACGHVAAASRPSQAKFQCVACGHTDNADLNAARNIRRRGLAQLHGEGRSDLPTLMNRETDRKMAA